MEDKPLTGKVALVTGASRRVGYGAAIGLGEAGATVYMTGRTLKEGEGPTPFRGALETTAKEVEALGGKAIPIKCDHSDDRQVGAVFEQIDREQGQIDLLVNNAWGGYTKMLKSIHIDRTGQIPVDPTDPSAVESYSYWDDPFWKQAVTVWDDTFLVGVRSAYVSSVLAAQRMVRQNSGLIVSISAGGGVSPGRNPMPYGAAHAALDRMTKDMAVQFAKFAKSVAATSLYPCWAVADPEDEDDAETPMFVGRSIAALAGDKDIMKKTGRILLTRRLAEEYGFTDINGQRPTTQMADPDSNYYAFDISKLLSKAAS